MFRVLAPMGRLLLLGLLIGSATSANAGKVIVYTDRELALLQPIVQSFREQTGHEVEVVFPRAGVQETLDKNFDSITADVYITASINNLVSMQKAGMLEPVYSDVLTQNIAPEYRSPENEWFATARRARIVYTRGLIPGAAELTYEDLADPQFRGQICIRSGTHSYNQGLFGAVMGHLGPEKGAEWLTGLKANLARKPTGNDRAQMKAVTDGICKIAIANSYYLPLAKQHLRQRGWAEKLRVIFPKFRDGGTHTNISGMALLVTSGDVAAAVEFMEFQSTPEAQMIYVNQIGEYPVTAGVASNEKLAEWGELESDTLALNEIAGNSAWAKETVAEIGFND